MLYLQTEPKVNYLRVLLIIKYKSKNRHLMSLDIHLVR